jgi:hypothetical protein
VASLWCHCAARAAGCAVAGRTSARMPTLVLALPHGSHWDSAGVDGDLEDRDARCLVMITKMLGHLVPDLMIHTVAAYVAY